MQKDWNALVARADEPDLPLTLMGGYDALIGRVCTLAEHPDLSARAKGNLAGLLEYHDKEAKARRMAQDWLADAERHVEAWKALERRSDGLGMPVARMDEYAGWREAARTLAATGRMILGDDESYGAHLAAVAAGRPRARLVVDQLREWIETPHNRVGEWLAVVGRHMEVRDALQDAAPDRRIHLTAMASYVEWREEAQRLVEEGEDILSERKASRTRPDDITPGERRMSAALSEFGATIGDDDREIAARKARQQRHWARERARLGFAEGMGVCRHRRTRLHPASATRGRSAECSGSSAASTTGTAEWRRGRGRRGSPPRRTCPQSAGRSIGGTGTGSWSAPQRKASTSSTCMATRACAMS